MFLDANQMVPLTVFNALGRTAFAATKMATEYLAVSHYNLWPLTLTSAPKLVKMSFIITFFV